MFDVIMLVISLVIGMGIFRAPATVAQRSGDEALFYLAWITGGVIAVCGALTFAAIGRAMPVTGAYYRIFASAYHPVVAFAVNIIILVSNAASAAGVAIIGSEYIAGWLPGVPTSLTATVMIIALYGLNLLGLRTSATVQNVLIGIKLLMLGCIIAALFVVEPAVAEAVGAAASEKSLWESFVMALIAVSFTYGGYQSTINFGGEIRNSERRMPVAIVLGVVIITGIYLLHSLFAGRKAPANPWGGASLEWQCTSPPPHDNFSKTPRVGDCYDFSAVRWDEKQEGYVVDSEAHVASNKNGKGH